MQRRRVMLAAGKRSRLPREYQEVEYLESTGTQWIDTGILATQIGLVKIDQQFTRLDMRQEHGCTIFGSGRPNQIYVFRYMDQFVIQFGSGEDDVYFGFANLLRHEWIADLTSNSCQISQQKKENCKFVEWENPTVYTFHLFARKANITGNIRVQDHCFCRLFSSEFFNKVLTQIGNFVPCYRKSDDKPGLYDLCGSICPLTNSPFYINAGTGEFLVGPDIN